MTPAQKRRRDVLFVLGRCRDRRRCLLAVVSAQRRVLFSCSSRPTSCSPRYVFLLVVRSTLSSSGGTVDGDVDRLARGQPVVRDPCRWRHPAVAGPTLSSHRSRSRSAAAPAPASELAPRTGIVE